MTCQSAQKAVLAVICRCETATARAVFERINWWTPETIQEALDLMVFERRLVRITLQDGTVIYRRAEGRQ